MSSAAGLWKLFRDQAERGSGIGPKLFGFIAESVFTIIPESCSGSSRNSVRSHPGIAFTFARIPHRTLEGREERIDPLYYRLLKAFLRGSFEGTLNAPRLELLDAEHIRTITQRVLSVAAQQGNAVIVGRGSAYHLHDRPDALHVFVYAPFEEKVRRLREIGKTEEDATELVENVDSDRSEYIKKYFDVEWPARHFFHLMINTTMGDEMVVETIRHSVSMFDKQAA